MSRNILQPEMKIVANFTSGRVEIIHSVNDDPLTTETMIPDAAIAMARQLWDAAHALKARKS